MQQIQPQEQQWPQDKQLYQMQNWKKRRNIAIFEINMNCLHVIWCE